MNTTISTMERAGLSLRRRRRRPKTPPPMSLPLLLLLAAAAAADIASAAPLAARGSKSSVRLNAGQKVGAAEEPRTVARRKARKKSEARTIWQTFSFKK